MIRRLLLVDDDAALRAVLASALTEEGYEVTIAANGALGLKQFKAQPFDLLILDVLMPELDGLELCRKIRAQSKVPIILLTSRSEEADKVNGLELGADDYLTKPFSIRELNARIRALGRRLEPAATDGALTSGPLVVDRARFEVTWNAQAVALTKSELLILAALVQQRGFVLTRDRLLDLAKGGDVVVTDRTVDTFIKRIRKKLKAVDDAFDEIETVIGVGYKYRGGP
jgi:DNA-binding response OmpR family regulator